MGLFNLLETSIPVFGKTFDVSLNWIGELIRWLCTSIGVVGVGIIVFSLLLKLITLPFDVFQRISMRKQNIQMKENKEKMEKLQQQYADDKKMYNQKVMEMYKSNGVSVFSSCLPLILSMVIFIVAINAFNAFAQYSNIENYNTMVDAYNSKMLEYCVDDVTEDTFGNITETVADDVDSKGNVLPTKTVTYTVKDADASSANYIYFKAYRYVKKGETYAPLTQAQTISYVNNYANKAYFVEVEKAKAQIGAEKITEFMTQKKITDENEGVRQYLVNEAQNAVVGAYNSTVSKNMSFLWIKNIWTTDASYKSPVLSAEDFVTAAKSEEFEVNGKDVSYSGIFSYTNAYKTETYNQVTAKLGEPKNAANGYYILIVLSIGTILLQQFLMQRSQKEQQKYSSVDGSSGGTQKMTMILMTGMFAVFSFMYSSAFSIYLITSNLFSMLSTFVINKSVDRRIEKKTAVATVKKYENHAYDRIEKAKKAGKASAEKSRKKND